MPQFPARAARRPRGQAPLCHYARRPVANRPEGAFGSLRYAFGGDHPSQTARQAVSAHISALGAGRPKGRISTPAPRTLARPLRSLRPILHIGRPTPALSCSKGSRGLFVPSRVIGIFTDTTISPGPRSRQRPDHYTIRAGRNLPDKEFRYLRTVIVTAAVYRGFGSDLPPRGVSPPLDLPAPGRCQAVYSFFRIRTALCFW